MRIGFFAVLALFVVVPAAAQDGYDEDSGACGDGSTQAIVECIDAETEEWDERLNAAYGEVMDALEGERRDGLRDAQRSWIAFRDANCLWYAGGEGTISHIEAAECLRAATEQRASELELLAGEGQ